MAHRVTPRWILVGALTPLGLTGISCAPNAQDEPASSVLAGTFSVPSDASSIQAAVDAAVPGATIEIGPGTYEESILVDTPDLTLRGTDRNDVVLDGSGLTSSGIVVTADGVQVENLTVRDYDRYGVLVTGKADDGIEGFAVRYVTASNNGRYGIYAFASHDGVVEHNYASGHPDSGIYVGQCEPCDVVVRANVAEHNAVGYEQTNASGRIYVVGNRFAHNRVGLTLTTDQEAFVPQHDGVVAGNLIAYNAAIGIGIDGGRSNELRSNRVVGNPLRPIDMPERISFRDVGAGPRQPNMPPDTVHTAACPDVRLDDVSVPGLDLLADLARGAR